MIPENESLLINKQALIQAILEHERQEAYRTFMLWEYLENLESLIKKFLDFISDNPEAGARHNLLELLQPGQEWSEIITDELVERWEKEFKAEYEKDLHRVS